MSVRSYHGYKLLANSQKQHRPSGVALFAFLGVLGSLAVILLSLVQLLLFLRVSAQPSIQLAVLAGVLALALICLWINWGLWELIRWAWWANLLLTLISGGGLIAALRLVLPLGAALAKLRPDLAPAQIANTVLVAIIALLIYQLIVAIYMLSARAAFGVGVKDERPLWERVHRH
jgi:hypothetical protein